MDLEAIVDHRDGRLRDWKLRAATDADALFVPAVEEVIGHWRYRRITRKCRPLDAPIRTRVWFEWAGDEPKVSMERIEVKRDYAPPAPFKPIERVPPRYPSDMLRRGYHSDVYALMRIEADGVPSSVDAVAYPIEAADRLGSFVDSVKRTLLQWRYPPRAEGPWLNCIEVRFRITK